MLKKPFLSLLASLLILSACERETCEGTVPVISFNEVQRGVRTTKVILDVKDCDGDIGLTQADTSGLYKYNAFIDIRPWLNGDWAENVHNYIDTSYREIKNDSGVVIGQDTIYDTLNFYYRVPVVENESRSDIFEAKIELEMGTSFFGFDTFRFEARLRDQALNESNTALSATMFGR